MLQLKLLPDCIVFQNLDYEMMNQLQDLYRLEFTIENDVYSIPGCANYLYKLLYKLTQNYDVELN